MKISDKIIALCKSKDRTAQKQLYRQLLPYLNVICKRYLNDSTYLNDVLQETFILLFTKIEQYDSSKGIFKTWAVRIAINCSLKHNKKNAKSILQELILSKHEQKIDPAVYTKYSDEEVMIFLKQMPEQYFQVFNLYEIDGFSHKEIADLLKIGESLSRKRLSRAKTWLEKRIEPEQFRKTWDYKINRGSSLI